MFPEDSILIARGKYSTLGKQKREQMQRAQKATDYAMVRLQTFLKLMNTDEPTVAPLAELRRCLDSLDDAGSKIVSLTEQMKELKSEAWDETASDV
jgi:hypothetical protein